jgi:hypothetical protein
MIWIMLKLGQSLAASHYQLQSLQCGHGSDIRKISRGTLRQAVRMFREVTVWRWQGPLQKQTEADENGSA